MQATTVLLLDDRLVQRVILTWHLVPAAVRRGGSPFDISSHVARVSGCSIEEAMGHVSTLLAMEVIYPDGTVDEQAATYLESKAAARIYGAAGYNPERAIELWLERTSVEEARAWLMERMPALFDDKELDWESEEVAH